MSGHEHVQALPEHLMPEQPQEQPAPQALRPEPALQSNLQRVTDHIRYAPFRLKGYAVTDAASGERLAGPFLTEAKAEHRLKKLRKQFPSAFGRGRR
jgi:hypothetical protein